MARYVAGSLSISEATALAAARDAGIDTDNGHVQLGSKVNGVSSFLVLPKSSGARAIRLGMTRGETVAALDAMTQAWQLAAAAAHAWPGHPDSPRPFPSLQDVREVIAPHKR